MLSFRYSSLNIFSWKKIFFKENYLEKNQSMKKCVLFFLLILGFAFSSNAQVVFADPAVGTMSFYNLNNEPQDPYLIPLNGIVTLKVPIRNNNLTNSIPPGTTKVKINLGSKLVIDPSFTVSSANTNQYFAWTASVVSGNVQIEGNLVGTIPKNFSDTAIFRLKGAVIGPANVTTNFLITNHNSGTFILSDLNGNNNAASIAYEVVQILPVTFTSLTTLRSLCNIKVDFKTENEVNVDRFEIEVSNDGISYKKEGTLPAQNAGYYNFIFDASNMSAKNLFVRIKSVDFDGQYQYSIVSKVNGNCTESENNILLFPNPAPTNISYFNLRNETSSFNGTYFILISDISGRILTKKKMILVNQTQFRFEHVNLPAGAYIVQLISENGDQVYSNKWQKF